MADVHGSPGDAPQMPQAATPGPAPVPYGGPDLSPEPPAYAVPDVTYGAPGVEVMNGVSGNALQESGYAHDMNAGLVVPAVMGSVSPIYVGGDADAGGRDTVAGTVGGAVANAAGRFHEHLGDVTNSGPGYIGDLMPLPPSPLDPGVGSTGVTDPAGAFYDPPRGY